MIKEKLQTDEAVSPIVGVMLMLVVTIIIAAVVSGLSGNLVSGTEQAPTMTADVKIVNAGYYYPSIFQLKVTGVSEPIPSSDVKIVTTWKLPDGNGNQTTVLPNVANQHYGNYNYPAPLATGPGVDEFGVNNNRDPSQFFGNYTIDIGTSMHAYPAGPWGPWSDDEYGGYGPITATYEYADGTDWSTAGSDIDDIQAILGIDWNLLRAGDIVNVKLVHIPSGQTIFDKDVAVEEGM